MEIIRGFLRKNKIQTAIYSFIFLISFVFEFVSIFLGYQLHSFVGILLIGVASVYLYIIMSTVMKLQVMADRNIWKSLFRYGLLLEEKLKITAAMDGMLLIFSMPVSVVLGNYIIGYLLRKKGILWNINFICILVEVLLFGIAYCSQNRFLSFMFEKNQDNNRVRVYENIPLFLKNVLRNSTKMMGVVGMICTGVTVCNGILFILNCDKREVYINKAISVDYFLTGYDTRSNRTSEETVRESDIEKVENNEFFQAGGRLFHSLDADRVALITDQLPETSKFPVFFNRSFETNIKDNYFVNLYGADDFVFSNMELYEGEIDYEKLAGGDAIIYGLERNPEISAYAGSVSDEWKYFEIGDQVTLDGAAGQKTYEIMAICIVNHTYAEEKSYIYAGHELVFYLPAEEYLSFGKEGAMRYLFCTKNGTVIDGDLEKENIGFESKHGWEETYLSELKAIRNSAVLFAFGCVGVGFFVYGNLLIVSYLDRRKEFQILGNIGMTSGQLQVMVLGEGISYGIMISVINVLAYVFIEFTGKQVMTGEDWLFVSTVKPLMICTVSVLAVSAIVPMSVYRRLVK